jgi:hypothetical protein
MGDCVPWASIARVFHECYTTHSFSSAMAGKFLSTAAASLWLMAWTHESSVMIPLNLVDPWSRTIVDSEPETTIEETAHVGLTSLCESRLTATAAMSITHFPIQNQENPVWKQCLEAMPDLEGPHFNVGMATMAMYAQYLFNLQHNTATTVMEQRLRLTAYDEHNTAISHELEQLKHENGLLCSGTLPPSDQDHELKVT